MINALRVPFPTVAKRRFAAQSELPKDGQTGFSPERGAFDEAIFSAELSGQRILGVGAHSESYVAEALRRGAGSAVGLAWEWRHDEVAPAQTKLPAVEYVDVDFDDWHAPPLDYDVVFCLDVLHRLHDPIGTVRKLMRVTRRRLFIGFTEKKPGVVQKAKRVLGLQGSDQAPVFSLNDPGKRMEPKEGLYTFSRSALSHLVNMHSSAFEPVLFHSDGKSRVVLEARRRSIDHLIVVAGPNSVGKSSFVAQLSEPKMRRRFGIDGTFETASANTFRQLKSGPISNLVYHYDMLRPFGALSESHRHDPAFDLLACAKQLTIITLWNSVDELRRRIFASEISRKRNERREADRHEALYELYGTRDFLARWYSGWRRDLSTLTACEKLNCFVVKTDAGYAEEVGYDALLQQLSASSVD